MKLQGIYGEQKEKAVSDLNIGDILIWNYGYKSEVVGMIPSKTGKTITCMLKSLQDGVVRERKMLASRKVAVDED